jgi:hypothetical protein
MLAAALETPHRQLLATQRDGLLMRRALSVRAFALLGFALGVIVAGRVAVRVMHAGVSPLAFTHIVVGLVMGVVLLGSWPLLVFTDKLLEAWRRGIFAYGALASDVGRQFERKWLTRTEALDAGALAVPDFSAASGGHRRSC